MKKGNESFSFPFLSSRTDNTCVIPTDYFFPLFFDALSGLFTISKQS